MKIITIIPARGGSKSIPKKNLVSFLGEPLIAKSIQQSLNAKSINRTIVSTDDSEISQIAEKYGAEIVHVVNLVDRSLDGINFGFPSTALLNLPSESFEPESCPQCIQGISLTERGRTGK